MIALLKAEWRKAATTKVLWGLVIAAILFACLNVALLILLRPSAARDLPSGALLTNPDYITNIIGSAGSSAFFALILGIIGMTAEFRHLTITATFLASPRRSQVLVAKTVMYLLIGAVMGAVTFAVSFGLAVALLASRDHAPIDGSQALQILGGVALGYAIYAVVGVALGALVRVQVAAVIGALAFTLIAEPLLGIFFDWVGKWLPGGALRAVLQATSASGRGVPSDLLPVWAGALVLIAYAVAFGAVASATTLRRDIT